MNRDLEAIRRKDAASDVLWCFLWGLAFGMAVSGLVLAGVWVVRSLG